MELPSTAGFIEVVIGCKQVTCPSVDQSERICSARRKRSFWGIHSGSCML